MKVLVFLVADPELYPRGPPLPREMVPVITGLIEIKGWGGVE